MNEILISAAVVATVLVVILLLFGDRLPGFLGRFASEEKRRQDAERRQRLKPLTDKVRKVESQLTTSRNELEALEALLADECLYTDADRNSELADLVRQQSSLKEAIETLEWNWMEASEALEAAGQGN